MAAGLLAEAGHTVVGSPEEADAYVVLTCTVKTPTETKVIKRLRELSSSGRPLVVAGCMPKAQRELVAEAAPEASLVGPDDLLSIVDAVDAALDERRVEEIDGSPVDRTCLPRLRANPVVHIAPISTGCLGNCSYCIVRRARGRLHSFPAEQIVEDARRAIDEGCREIWVTAEDTAAYSSRGTDLPGLLDEICDIDGRFLIRVGMMTPNQAYGIVDDLVEAFRSEKMFKFLHVPVQSGNDEVLERMRRRYTVDEFRELVTRFRDEFTRMSLSTDVICGFPGETEEQFDDSLRLVEEVSPEVLNISRFWSRPGTDAAALDGQHHGRVTKARSRALSSLWRPLSLKGNKRWVGWEGEIVIDEVGRDKSMMGRNLSYKPVVVRGGIALGEFIRVRVTDATSSYLRGFIV